jgi:Na+-transporting NADH:ubiquinone oxidoreductase subunit A
VPGIWRTANRDKLYVMRELSYEIREGLDLRLPGAPHSSIDEGARVSRVAVLGSDYPGVRPRVVVRHGERVRTGQALAIDRRRPEVRITSPVSVIGCGWIRS